MKKLLLSTLITLISLSLLSQSCLPEGITFITQQQIDNFQADNPGCTEIEGDVEIGTDEGDDITNLNGLNVLTSIGGSLGIVFTDLTSLSGLENLTAIGGSLSIYAIGISDLTGLDNLTSIVGGLWISENGALTSLSGLNNLTSIGESLGIEFNLALINLSGLENISNITGNVNISYNSSLLSLSGLDNLGSIGGYFKLLGNVTIDNLSNLNNLTSIGGLFEIGEASKFGGNGLTSLNGLENLISIGSSLIIRHNPHLQNLSGLDGLNSVGGGVVIGDYQNYYLNSELTSLSGLDNINAGSITDLYIFNNPLLQTCEVKSICDYLVAPNGTIEISNNALGCNSQEEVEDACGIVSINNLSFEGGITTSPNPFTTSTTLSYELKQPEKVSFSIYNNLSQIVYQTEENQPQGTQQLKWNAEAFADGIYYFRLKVGDAVANGKMLKVR